MPVLLTLSLQNRSELDGLLRSAGADGAADHRPVVSSEAFGARFGVPAASYDQLVAFLGSFGVGNLTSYPDRLAVSFSASPEVLSALFGTSLHGYRLEGQTYVAPSSGVSMPAPLASWVSNVEGLGSGPLSKVLALPVSSVGTIPIRSGTLAPGRSALVSAPGVAGGYPAPVVATSGAQMLFPTDLQVAYDELSLLAQFGPATTENVAALLWSGTYGGNRSVTLCGSLSTGQSVGPYVPSDFSDFFNLSSPAGQAHPQLEGVPLSGAGPSCLASWDTTGAVLANTAELESLGALVPGATVWALSVGQATLVNLDTELKTVLSPPTNLSSATQAGLRAVNVVEVPWFFPDQVDAAWAADLDQARLQGVTIVTPTGDAADSNLSPAWTGTSVVFPSTAATNMSGSLAVGGTTLHLNPSTLHITSEVGWYNGSAGGPFGSSGGTSSSYPEPSWQASSLAASAIAARGRGVPDVSAIANNTLVLVSFQANAPGTVPEQRLVAGTGVASAVVAGLCAEIDHALNLSSAAPLAFANPVLYYVATEEQTPLPNGSIHGSHLGSSPYVSSLPTLPLRDVVFGQNALFSAGIGYDLVTGWGSLDAYNLTMYVLPVPNMPTWGRLQAVEDFVNLTGLDVVSTYPPGPSGPSLAASLQQNLFVANALGAPVYWVQSVTTLAFQSTGIWTIDFQGWIVLPFWGLYPQLAVYEFWVPPTTTTTLPLSMAIETALLPGSLFTPPQIEFGFGPLSAPIIKMPLPGGSYILGAQNHTYNWQGTNYTNGPNGSAPGGNPGFLAPQFALVGYPGGATGNFLTGTSGTVQAFVEPMSSSAFVRAGTGLVTPANTQTGESAGNLSFTSTSSNTYTFASSSLTGRAEQGIYQFEVPRFTVKFFQTGAPARSTWYVNLTGTRTVSGSAPASVTTLQFQLPNGTYQWSASIDVKDWSSVPRGATLTVAGPVRQVNLTFGPSESQIVFFMSGVPAGKPPPFHWTVTVTGGPTLSGNTSTLNTTLLYGSYSYRFSIDNTSYKPSGPTGSFTVSNPTTYVYLKVKLVVFLCELIFELPGGISPHMLVTIGSHHGSGYYATFSARLPNGSHPWSVTQISDSNWATPSSGVFLVNGSGPGPQGRYIAVVTLHAPANGGLFGLGIYGYVLVGGIAVAAVLGVVLVVRRRRRGRTVSESFETLEAPEPPSEPSSVFDEER